MSEPDEGMEAEFSDADFSTSEIAREEVLFIGEPGPADLAHCWRCGKLIERSTTVCPHCGAWSREADEQRRAEQPQSSDQQVSRALRRISWMFGGLLGTLILLAWVSRFLLLGTSPDDIRAQETQFSTMLVFDVITSVFTVVACLLMRPPPVQWWRGWSNAARVWVIGFVLLALVLVLNIAYHDLLSGVLHLQPREEDLNRLKLSPMVLVAVICVQPAIFEELFFRYFVLGHFKGVLTDGTAVVVTAIMFGMSHLGVMASVPILTLVGIVLGLTRIWGGGLLLPMFLHFVHNFVVIHHQGMI